MFCAHVHPFPPNHHRSAAAPLLGAISQTLQQQMAHFDRLPVTGYTGYYVLSFYLVSPQSLLLLLLLLFLQLSPPHVCLAHDADSSCESITQINAAVAAAK